jgi:hypothetical protein
MVCWLTCALSRTDNWNDWCDNSCNREDYCTVILIRPMTVTSGELPGSDFMPLMGIHFALPAVCWAWSAYSNDCEEIHSKEPRTINYKSRNNVPMKTVFGNTVCIAQVLSVVPPVMLAATLANMESLQPQGNRFHHLMESNYLHIFWVMYPPSFIFIGKILCDKALIQVYNLLLYDSIGPWCLLVIPFDPEDGGGRILRNVGLILSD